MVNDPVYGAIHRPSFATVLVLATTTGFFSLFAVSVLSPFIITELGLSRAAYGSVSAVIYVSASCTSLVAGRVIERLSGGAALSLLFSTSVLAWVLIAAAQGFSSLLIGAVAAGFPLGLAIPITTGLVRAQLPADRRGTFLGIAQSGSQVGALLAGASLPLLARLWSWRWALLSATSVALVGILMVSRTYLGDRRSTAWRAGTDADRAVIVWLSLYGFGMNAGVTIVTAYLPIFAFEALDLSPSMAGALLVVIALISFVSKVLWGRATDAATRARSPLALLGGLAVVSTVTLAVTTTEVRWLVWVAVVVFGIGGVSWAVVTMTAVARLLPPAGVGRAAGNVMLASFFGAALAPIAFGSLVDVSGGYRSAWMATAGLFALATTVMAVWHPDRRTGTGGRGFDHGQRAG